ncbi:MAG: alpha-N-acetylglucosaminidase C-terminal domain-containing protein [Bacteroidales bacterium]|nr:alpha-N-acetylglucosaminidase C-terminal domain-containing protein [Bacteroidales bacterium]
MRKKMNLKHLSICAAAAMLVLSCQSPAERAAAGLARRIAPEYARRIEFRQTADSTESYSIEAHGRRVRICGSGANAMAAGLGRFLSDVCCADVSWERLHPIELPAPMPLPDSTISCRALVPERFFLNYCTFGYTMPWWQWDDWERFIDWMAMQGINLPLAITGQDAIWQEVWRGFGLSDDEIRAWFTGPAHLPWHRMCNIDGVDGPLPQGWIDGQKELLKKILQRERELGMHPVLPAFSGHIPKQFKELYPDAQITQIRGWCGFPEENRPYFLSPQDSLYGVVQKAFLEAQTREFGTDHLYGFDLFNEIEPPSWDPQTLAAIGGGAYRSIADADPEGRWIQMGWMFYNDSRHWTPELIRAYLGAVPEGKVTILDYYTENVPVWKLTDSFYGQPWIFCYLGNFGGNTRLAGPFRTESQRITEALGMPGLAGHDGNVKAGGPGSVIAGGSGSVIAGSDRQSRPSGIGCTLEGFGVNRWFFEYVLSRAWSTGMTDEEWLSGLDRRRGSPDCFWRNMADSIYLRGSFSEGTLLCGRPVMTGRHDWRVIYETRYDPDALVRQWKTLLDAPSSSDAWRYDAVNIGCQALGDRFAVLRDEFAGAFRYNQLAAAEEVAEQMRDLLKDIATLAACEPSFRFENWLKDAGRWAGPGEEPYYRHNAWQIVTVWGDTPYLGDYASRMWSGLISTYYAPRWEIFLEEALDCLRDGRPYEQQKVEELVGAFEKAIVEAAPTVSELAPSDDIRGLCNKLYIKWFGKKLTLMSWNVGVFSKYSQDSMADVARAILRSGADAACLCELDSCNRRHPEYQLKELAESLGGWQYSFASAFDFAGGAYGNGIVCKEPILRSERIALPLADGAEPRSCAVVETERFVLGATHLDHKGFEARPAQARALNDWFTEHYSGSSKPVFLCGDFNSLPDSETLSVLSDSWDLISGTSPTYPSDSPDRCIDYIFTLRSAAPVYTVSSYVDSTCSAASDHLPVTVSVKYN